MLVDKLDPAVVSQNDQACCSASQMSADATVHNSHATLHNNHAAAVQHPMAGAAAGAWESRTSKMFVSGGLAGAVSRTATAPLDRLKLLLQVQDTKHGMTVKEVLAQGCLYGCAVMHTCGVVHSAVVRMCQYTPTHACTH